ncbi:hypothetical protein BH11PSE9_BH11PSE9_09120 [soil metagenome]
MNTDLKQFLVRKRGRISPESVGLVAARGRRSPGLTREDMAQLTGVSFKWYTMFESGSSAGVSRKFAERVASALALNEAERRYLLGALGFAHRPEPLIGQPALPSGLQRLMQASQPSPAALYSSLCDVLDCNEAYAALFPKPDAQQPFGNNALWRLFMEPAYRAVWSDWQAAARCMITTFRPRTAHLVDSPEYGALMAALDQNPDFRRTWNHAARHASQAANDGTGADLAVVVPGGRRVHYDVVALQSTEAQDVYLMSFVPAREAALQALEAA